MYDSCWGQGTFHVDMFSTYTHFLFYCHVFLGCYYFILVIYDVELKYTLCIYIYYKFHEKLEIVWFNAPWRRLLASKRWRSWKRPGKLGWHNIHPTAQIYCLVISVFLALKGFGSDTEIQNVLKELFKDGFQLNARCTFKVTLTL